MTTIHCNFGSVLLFIIQEQRDALELPAEVPG